MKSKGGMKDTTHSHWALSGPSGGKKCSGNGVNVNVLPWSPRKG